MTDVDDIDREEYVRENRVRIVQVIHDELDAIAIGGVET